MELQEFVTESLNQILKGVSEAQRANKYNGIQVNPELAHYLDSSRDDWIGQDHKLPDGILLTPDGRVVAMVDFDVAVTTTEGTGTKGGIGIFAGAVGLGTQGATDTSSTAATRLKFRVPVVMPNV